MRWVTRRSANVDRVARPSLHGEDDHAKIRLESPMYDALYAWCREQVRSGER